MSAPKHKREYVNPTVRKCPKRLCRGWMATVFVRYYPRGPLIKEWECIECSMHFPNKER